MENSPSVKSEPTGTASNCQEYDSMNPSGSFEPVELKFTLSPKVMVVLSALAMASGGWFAYFAVICILAGSVPLILLTVS